MQLHEQVQTLKKADTIVLNQIQDYICYLVSPKFHNDTTVQVSEPLQMLKDIRLILSTAFAETEPNRKE